MTEPQWWEVSIVVQVMAWCRQATSHHLNQSWPRSMSQYGLVTVLSLIPDKLKEHQRILFYFIFENPFRQCNDVSALIRLPVCGVISAPGGNKEKCAPYCGWWSAASAELLGRVQGVPGPHQSQDVHPSHWRPGGKKVIFSGHTV